MTEPTGNMPTDDQLSARVRWYGKTVTWSRDTWSANASYFAAGFAVLSVGLAALVVLQAAELHQRYPKANWGTIPEAFAAVGTVAAVGVALWQSNVIRRQAKEDAENAQARLANELAAAEQRSAREVENARDLHQIELDAQREQARIQRVHLREQEFKLALIRVSRAINAFTHMLATLVEECRRVVDIPEARDRDDELVTTSEKLGVLAQDVVLEISGAHMLTRDDRLHDALNKVNAAVGHGIQAEMALRHEVVTNGRMAKPVPVFRAQAAMQEAMGNARRMAGDLLDTGWD